MNDKDLELKQVRRQQELIEQAIKQKDFSTFKSQLSPKIDEYLKSKNISNVDEKFKNQIMAQTVDYFKGHEIDIISLSKIDKQLYSNIISNLYGVCKLEERYNDYQSNRNSSLASYLHGKTNEFGNYDVININNLSGQIVKIQKTQLDINANKINRITGEVQNIDEQIQTIKDSEAYKFSQNVGNILDQAIDQMRSLKQKDSNDLKNYIENKNRNDLISGIENKLHEVSAASADHSIKLLEHQANLLDQEALSIISSYALPPVMQSATQQDKFFEFLIDMTAAKAQIEFASTIKKNAASPQVIEYKSICDEIIKHEKANLDAIKSKLLENNAKYIAAPYKDALMKTRETNNEIFKQT